MARQSGITLLGLLIAVTAGAMILVLGSLATVPWLARETMRGTLHDAGSLLRVARTEAVRRSHDCRFIVDLSARTISVVDTNGTSSSSDDLVLRRTRLPSVVSVARPDGGSAITFAEASGSVYLVQFDPGGYVSSGAGEMVLYGGECYRKLVVYSAGGMRYEIWNGSTWEQG